METSRWERGRQSGAHSSHHPETRKTTESVPSSACAEMGALAGSSRALQVNQSRTHQAVRR
eukprot:4370217-Prorocentrum_lima.AAC.1